jgi:periplasmic copper chaperone A
MHSVVRSLVPSLVLVGALVGAAEAHVSISSGPAAANKSQQITFAIGHGCEDANAKHLDTIKVRVTIPAGVTSVRALRSDFGKPTVIKTGTTVTAVEWTKPVSELLDEDNGYYELKIRARVPDAPFTKLEFEVQQTCEDSTNHAQIVVDWNADEGSTTGEPAPYLTVVPARTTGWNKFTVPRAVPQDEVPTYLGDALIVWKGTAAYSPNPTTAMLITTTPGVTPLDGLAANDEIWVKY